MNAPSREIWLESRSCVKSGHSVWRHGVSAGIGAMGGAGHGRISMGGRARWRFADAEGYGL
jgi:hypothetical protein